MWIFINFFSLFQMNTTRSIWSKTLNCCKLRRHPEIIFLCVTGVISFLPLLFYVVVRFCGPIRDLPNVLKRKFEELWFNIFTLMLIYIYVYTIAEFWSHKTPPVFYRFISKCTLLLYRIKIQPNNLEVSWWKNKLDWY